MSLAHIIHRQLLDLHVPRKEDAVDIQNRLSAVSKTELSTVLEQLCDRTLAPDQFLQIQKLEIDLGMIRRDQLEAEFLVRFRREFEAALSERTLWLRHSPDLDALPDRELGTEGLGRDRVQMVDGEDRLISARAMQLQLIQYFLSSGRLPWWSDQSAVATLEPVIEKLLETAPDELVAQVQTRIRSRPARHRLIHQFSDEILIRLVSSAAPGLEQPLRSAVRVLDQGVRRARIPDLRQDAIRLVIWDAILTVFEGIKGVNIELLQAVLDRIIRRHPDAELDILDGLQTAGKRLRHSEGSSLPEFIMSFMRRIESHLHRLRSAEPIRRSDTPPILTAGAATADGITPGAGADKDAATGVTGLHPDNISAGDSAGDHAPPASAEKTAVTAPAARKTIPTSDFGQEIVGQEKLAVQNAGLVILWPYFKHFFDSLGLLDAGGNLKPSAGMRAIHLLQYLVTGEKETPEFMLTLNKLFCGWDLEETVCKSVEFTAEEIEAADQLLGAAVEHWSALKRTSRDGLRTAFLQRNGMLSEAQNHWLLQVEHQAHDILLDRLPWGISMIRLSWMKKMLRVDWAY